MLAAKSTFGTYQNIINVLQQNSVIGIIACGMTFAIILGGFDLSVGAVTALSSVVGATLMIDAGALGIPDRNRRRAARLPCRRSDQWLADRLSRGQPVCRHARCDDRGARSDLCRHQCHAALRCALFLHDRRSRLHPEHPDSGNHLRDRRAAAWLRAAPDTLRPLCLCGRRECGCCLRDGGQCPPSAFLGLCACLRHVRRCPASS